MRIKLLEERQASQPHVLSWEKKENVDSLRSSDEVMHATTDVKSPAIQEVSVQDEGVEKAEIGSPKDFHDMTESCKSPIVTAEDFTVIRLNAENIVFDSNDDRNSNEQRCEIKKQSKDLEHSIMASLDRKLTEGICAVAACTLVYSAIAGDVEKVSRSLAAAKVWDTKKMELENVPMVVYGLPVLAVSFQNEVVLPSSVTERHEQYKHAARAKYQENYRGLGV